MGAIIIISDRPFHNVARIKLMPAPLLPISARPDSHMGLPGG